MLAEEEMSSLERNHATRVLRGLSGVDKTIEEVVSSPENKRRKIRRRVEDYLRKCPPEELGLVVAICGIKTEVVTPKVRGGTDESLS